MEVLEKPELDEPILLAAWPGMGLLAFKTVLYLVEKLEAVSVGTTESENRFAMKGISVSNGLVDKVTLPQSRLFFRAETGEQDLLLLLGDEQPAPGKEWAYAHEILQDMEELGARRLITFAAMPQKIDHRAEPGVWGAATHARMLTRLREHDVKIMSGGTVTGINGLLLGAAKQRGWEGYCLLGEIPLFMTQMENPRGCRAVLEKVASLFDIDVDLKELRLLAHASSSQLDHILQHLEEQHAREDMGEGDDEGHGPLLN